MKSGWRTPAYFLKGEELKEYKQIGKVREYIMDGENIIELTDLVEYTFEEFKRLDKEEKAKFLYEFKDQRPYDHVKILMNAWGATRSTINSYYYRYKEKDMDQTETVTEVKNIVGFVISIQGVLSGKKTADRLMSIASILDEESEYVIELIIKEK